MNAYVRFYIYTAVLCFAAYAVIYAGKRDKAIDCLKYLLLTTLGAEVCAHVIAIIYRNNMVVYQLFVPLQLILIGWYYHYSNPVLKKYRVGSVITVLALTAAILNALLLQPMNTFNSNVMLFSGFCVIALALATFYRFYLDETQVQLAGNIHFRVSLIFLFYWSCTFISYAFHEALEKNAFHRVYLFIWVVNLVTYLGLGFVFRSLTSNRKQDA